MRHGRRPRWNVQHLDRRQLSREALFRRGVHRIQRAQPHEYVLFERRVVRNVPAGQRFASDVDVSVDHPGRHDESITADDVGCLVGRFEVGLLADRDDLVPSDRDGAMSDDVARFVHRDDVTADDERVD